MQENSNMLSQTKEQSVINVSNLKSLIYIVRDHQVMVDSDLATLYQVETGALNRAVKRNISRFPDDFCFQLTEDEYINLKCQNGISSLDSEYGARTYHIGASLKDAGKKCFGISLLEDGNLTKEIMSRLHDNDDALGIS